MKKKLSIVTSAALLLSLGFTMAGCGANAAKLAPKYKGDYSATLTNINSLYAGIDYSFGASDETGLVIVSTFNEAAAATTYQVYDVTTDSFVAGISSTSPLSFLGNGLLYSQNVVVDADPANPVEPTYNLFTRAGSYRSFVTGTAANNVFTTDSGERIYVGVDGEVAAEADITKEICIAAHVTEVGKYFVEEGDGVFKVYDKKGKHKRTFIAEYELGMLKGETMHAMWGAGTKMFIQSSFKLADSAEDYDYYTPEGKFDLITRSYDIANGKVKNYKNFDFIVTDVETGLTDDYAFVEVQEVKDGYVSEASYWTTFGADGDIYVDLQKLAVGAEIPNISDDGKYVEIKDAAGYTRIFKGSKEVLALSDDIEVETLAGDDLCYSKNGTLYMYDLKKKEVVNTVTDYVSVTDDASVIKTVTGDIVYATSYDDGVTVSYSLWDTEDNYSTSLATATEGVSVSVNSTYYTTTTANVATGMNYKTVVFYDGNRVDNVSSFSYVKGVEIENVSYTIYEVTDATTNLVSYRLFTETFPEEK